MSGWREALAARARELGFDAVGVAEAPGDWPAAARLAEFLALGRHGEMYWLAETAARRAHPQAMWPEARSAVMVGMSYTPQDDPLQLLADKTIGAIAAYAVRRDYHEAVKGRLKTLAQWLVKTTGAEVKVFVDTAPLMEKPLAQAAGLGWQGKHTNLVSRRHGSWLVLGAILSAAQLPADDPEADHCGACRACLDICPTGAFPAPYQLDARRCLAYWSIEYAGHIPEEFRAAMGGRVFGCDDCLAVCPWNKFAQVSAETALSAREGLQGADLAELAGLDDQAFRARFAGTPIKRTGRDRFVRNVLIAIGNSGTPRLAAAAEARLGDASPLVRAAAVWALRRLLDREALAGLEKVWAGQEQDPAVAEAWRGG